LGSLAHGFAQVVILLTGEEAPEYQQALMKQVEIAQSILDGLGYAKDAITLLQAEDAPALQKALGFLSARESLCPLATFAFANEKRETLEAALEHLMLHWPCPLVLLLVVCWLTKTLVPCVCLVLALAPRAHYVTIQKRLNYLLLSVTVCSVVCVLILAQKMH
jgi:hypothetical protein